MIIKHKGRKLKIGVKKCGFARKFFGLMFRSRKTENLLFEFDKNEIADLHSFFVFFSFLVLWLDEENNVLEYEIVRPFRVRISSRKRFTKIVELPFNDNNKEIFGFFVGKERFK